MTLDDIEVHGRRVLIKPDPIVDELRGKAVRVVDKGG